MLRKVETDRTADSVEQVSSSDKQEFHVDEMKPLVWRRACTDNLIIQNLEKLVGMLGHAVLGYTRKVEKQVKQLKRF